MGHIVHQIKTRAGYIFQTQPPWIMDVAGLGTAAMEMSISNLVWTNTELLSIYNGFFQTDLRKRPNEPVVK